MIACYVSDLYFECCDNHPIIKNQGDILILGGDIGNPYENKYKIFLIDNSKNFNKVFLITSNHEYYSDGKSIDETNLHIEDIIKSNNLDNTIFLNNKSYLYGNYRFTGTTKKKI